MEVSVSLRNRQKGAGTTCCSCFETQACLPHTVCQRVSNGGQKNPPVKSLGAPLPPFQCSSHPAHILCLSLHRSPGVQNTITPQSSSSTAETARGLLKLAGNVCCRKGRTKIWGKGNCSSIWRAVTVWEKGLRKGC